MCAGGSEPKEHEVEMNNETPKPVDIRTLIERLAQAATSVDKDDLVGLVGLSETCASIVAACGADGEVNDAALAQRAASLQDSIEAVVLGEMDDAGAALAAIAERIAVLASAYGTPASSGGEVAGTPALTDEEVAERLARVFDDEAQTDTVCAASGEAAPPSGGSSPDTEEPSYEPVPLVLAENELEFVCVFMEEADEHVEAIEAALLEVESSPDVASKIDDLFRPFHTIKGGAGFLNLRDINSLTHEVETVMDQARRGARKITPGLIDIVFDVVDILKAQFSAIQTYLQQPTGDPIPQPEVSGMIAYLRDLVAGRVEPEEPERAAGGAGKRIGETLVEQGAAPQEVVDFAVATQRSGRTDKKTGEILIEAAVTTPKQVSKAIRAQSQAQPGTPAARGDRSVRIDTTKLDALVDMVGELVIAQTQVSANPLITHDPALTKNVGLVEKIVREVQELSMGMRMIPIGGTFQKMARLIRDVSRKAGKKVELIITGEETELDKNVIEQINDPLVHMVRNAVDHGIEPPDERIAAGKPEVGRVYLSAGHQGGNIVIDVRDDGRGLNTEKLIAKAIEKGIVQPDEELSEQQAYQLVFAPGFSLAEKVTDISGRGVGMDVVKRNLEQLRGRVDISSEVGKGSTFSMRLPLTLAIIDGMVVRVGTERFILQTIAVQQALRPLPEQITTVQHHGEVLNVRGQLVPLIQLGSLLGLTDRIDPCEAMVVLARCETGLIGLVVEELLGQQQVVIKTLGGRFEKLRGISGAAVLGDGHVGLILEVSGIEAVYASSRMPRKWTEKPVGQALDEDTVSESVSPASSSEEHRLAVVSS